MTNMDCLLQVIINRCPEQYVNTVTNAIDSMIRNIRKENPGFAGILEIEKQLAFALVDGIKYGNWPGVKI